MGKQPALESRDAIELLSNKWRIARDLQRALEGVSAKVLTQTLRGMERDGLIRRTVLSAVPARVEYELTPMGRSAIKPLGELCRWAKAHAA